MNQLSLCRKDVCIKAEGKYADAIAYAVVAMLLMVGFAALVRASK